MTQPLNHYVLVAEKSLLPVIGATLDGLGRHGDPSAIRVIVPGAQVELFKPLVPASVDLIAEEELLPDWPLVRVRSRLPRHPGRAGWYLQQFLKLEYGRWAAVERYVVWDADTVMLRRPPFWDGDCVLFAKARERHEPYFDTIERLLGHRAVLACSAIAQYMPMESAAVADLKQRMQSGTSGDWIEAVLAVLRDDDPSEFSEYETYANYFAKHHAGRMRMVDLPWFRYGAQVLSLQGRISLDEVARRFSRYDLVAFERHPGSLVKKLAARAMNALGIGS